VSVAGKVVGRLTSVAWSPGLQTAVALAYLHRDVEPTCPVEVQVEENGEVTAAAQALAVPLPV
jgi:glycine cleavage system aminomethyltransferase T